MANATAPQPDAAHRSLQINIDSEDDAHAVIQHLQAIKNRYDLLAESGLVDSIEFCIAAPIRRKVDADLLGAVRWCRTWLRSVAPFEGNVHYALPHYAPGPPRVPRAQNVSLVPGHVAAPAQAPVEQALAAPVDALLTDTAQPKPHGKSRRPVSAEAAVS